MRTVFVNNIPSNGSQINYKKMKEQLEKHDVLSLRRNRQFVTKPGCNHNTPWKAGNHHTNGITLICLTRTNSRANLQHVTMVTVF
jgi:hypothetical protein